ERKQHDSFKNFIQQILQITVHEFHFPRIRIIHPFESNANDKQHNQPLHRAQHHQLKFFELTLRRKSKQRPVENKIYEAREIFFKKENKHNSAGKNEPLPNTVVENLVMQKRIHFTKVGSRRMFCADKL